jgi:hypothetical protein
MPKPMDCEDYLILKGGDGGKFGSLLKGGDRAERVLNLSLLFVGCEWIV